MVDGASPGDRAQARLSGHSRLIVSAFGEKALNRLARDARESGCLDRRERLAEVPPAGGGVGSPMSIGPLTVCADVSYNCFAVRVERWREMVQFG